MPRTSQVAGGRGGVAAALAAALLYAGIIAALAPWRGVFAFDPDEGVNLIKAQLMARGATLYAPLWSDQPPLFTHLLRAWGAVIGWDVDRARLLVVLFAAATVFAVYDVARLEAGQRAGCAAAALLAASTCFPRLSVSVMIGLPALAFASLALWALFRWVHGGGAGWLLIGGGLMGGALATKLFTAFLVPLLALWLVWVCPARRGVRAALIWLAGTLATGAVLLLALVGPAHLHQLADTHSAARQSADLARFDARGLLAGAAAEWPLTLLGAAACLLLLVQRRRAARVFPAWAAVAALLLIGHVPVWYHHYLLLSLPLATAAGIGLAILFGGDTAPLPARALPWLRSAAAVLIVALPIASLRASWLPPPQRMDDGPRRVLAAMASGPRGTGSVFTSEPMYAVRSGADVPPALAVLSRKRLATDAGLHSAIDELFAAQPPDQVVIASSGTIAEWARAAMAERYRLLLTAGGLEVYGRRDAGP
ncbi:MAG: glycosyltransferase family 39 protein [Candidatus Binatia bacterium]